MRHLLDIVDFSVEEIRTLIDTAEDIIKRPQQYAKSCNGKKLATLFFEPSTRTRLSFEAAMYELGGNVIGFSSASSSSVAKGETVGDTISVVSHFADIIAMRHPFAGAPLAAVQKTLVPIINAGDGEHCHPTQTLADLLTIHREHGSFENLTIGVCGDLKYGRTVHSLIEAMIRYKGTKFVLISPHELKLPEYMKANLTKSGTEWVETINLEDSIPELDILYMTRVQGERFADKAEYERLKDSYILTPDKLTSAKKTLSVLHPLPRLNEISVKVDDDPRACYFKQVENGKYIRMALILKLLAEKEKPFDYITEGALYNTFKCTNRNCLTTQTATLDQIFLPAEEGHYRCAYCDNVYSYDFTKVSDERTY